MPICCPMSVAVVGLWRTHFDGPDRSLVGPVVGALRLLFRRLGTPSWRPLFNLLACACPRLVVGSRSVTRTLPPARLVPIAIG